MNSALWTFEQKTQVRTNQSSTQLWLQQQVTMMVATRAVAIRMAATMMTDGNIDKAEITMIIMKTFKNGQSTGSGS